MKYPTFYIPYECVCKIFACEINKLFTNVPFMVQFILYQSIF